MNTVRMPRTQRVTGSDGQVVNRKPIVGDLRWNGTVWRRWSGRRWARAAYSLHPGRLETATPLHQQPVVDEVSRQRALALAVEDQVATNAATVIFDGPRGVVLGYRRHVSHLAHAIMTMITGGLWAVVWLAMALGRREDRVQLEADPYGNVWVRPVAPA